MPIAASSRRNVDTKDQSLSYRRGRADHPPVNPGGLPLTIPDLIRCPDETCRHLNPCSASACERCGRALPRIDSDRSTEEPQERPLPIAGFKGTPEEIERQWFDQVYTGRGDRMRQLTLRAVVMGSVLGCILSLTNLYIGLKAGWGFGVAITACILSYAIVGSSRVDLQACKLEYSIVSPK